MSTMTIDQMFAGPTARATGGPRGAVRLTRRGRVVVVAFAVLVALAVGFVLASSSVATDEGGTPAPSSVVVVGPGDTLWEIASTVARDGSTGDMVDRIMKMNALDSGSLAVGQRLLVPAS